MSPARTVGLRLYRQVVRRWFDVAIWIFGAVVFVYLFAPVVTTVVFAFNKGSQGKQTPTITGWTTSWFSAAWNDQALRHSFIVSVQVAVGVAVLAPIIGTVNGVVIARYAGKLLRSVLSGLTYLLLVLPEIVLAVSMLVFFVHSNIDLGYVTLVAGQSPFAISVVTLIVRSRAMALDSSIDEAAADLGAGRFRVWRDALLPQLFPAILASVILSFTFSFDDLVTSVVLTTPTVTTLPVYIFSEVHSGLTPTVYATVSVMLGATIVGLGLAALAYRMSARRVGQVGSAMEMLGRGRQVRPAEAVGAG